MAGQLASQPVIPMATNYGQAHTTAATNSLTCDRCQARLRKGWTFALEVPAPPGVGGGQTPSLESGRCIWCALRHRAVVRRSAIASVVVGTALTLLNQGDTLLSGQWSNDLYWKVPLTYCVPFIVATYGALSNSRK